MSNVILYDLASKTSQCWSPYVWRIRLLLSYKRIPYDTQWIEYPDIGPDFKSKGISPGGSGSDMFTVPMIKIDGKYIMDSKAIAEELDRLYPLPPLPLETPGGQRMLQTFSKCFSPLIPVVIPNIAKNVINEASLDFFHRTREQRFGMPLEQVEREQGGEQAFAAAEPGWSELNALFKESGGPYLTGKDPEYADFVVVGLMEFARRAGQHIFDRIVAPNAALRELYDACGPWLARKD